MKKYIKSIMLLTLLASLVAVTGCECHTKKWTKTEKKEVYHKNDRNNRNDRNERNGSY